MREPWMVYLAHPIDQAPDELASLPFLRRALVKEGAWVYDPGQAWLAEDSPPARSWVQQVNDQALLRADGIMAVLPPEQGTFGVPIEIEKATYLGKPVAVWGSWDAMHSAALAPVREQGGMHDNWQACLDWLVARVASGTEGRMAERIETFLGKVRIEVQRAAMQHPRSADTNWTTPARWQAIWAEEVLEAIQAWNDREATDTLSEELVQVAAMTMRWWWSVNPA